MYEDVATKWIDALRSGKYEQGRKRLRIGRKFCVLGVLCDLHLRETGEGEWLNVSSKGSGVYRYGDDWNLDTVTAPPYSVVLWAGMDSREPPFLKLERPDGLSEEAALTHLNDELGFTFGQLADLIEQQWERL